MAKELGPELPPALLALLQGGAAYRPGGLGVPVLTVDDAGLPHCAVVNAAVAAKSRAVFVPVGAGSHTEHNIRRDGRCTLVLAGSPWLYYVKGHATVARPKMRSFGPMAAVRLAVQSVLDDTERIFEMTSGLTYRFVAEPEALAALEVAIIDELAAMAEEE